MLLDRRKRWCRKGFKGPTPHELAERFIDGAERERYFGVFRELSQRCFKYRDRRLFFEAGLVKIATCNEPMTSKTIVGNMTTDILRRRPMDFQHLGVTLVGLPDGNLSVEQNRRLEIRVR